MMRRPGLKQMSTNTGPNMTPMVDIVMCILIFFMLATQVTGVDKFLTSNLVAEKGVGMADKPELKAPAVTPRIEIHLDKTNKPVVLAFNREVTDLNGDLAVLLEQKQKELSADVQILIQPQNNVSYQDMITVYDQCIKAQFKNVAFVMPH